MFTRESFEKRCTGDKYCVGNTSTSSRSKMTCQDKLVNSVAFRHKFGLNCSAGQHRAAHSYALRTKAYTFSDLIWIKPPFGNNPATQASFTLCHIACSDMALINMSSATKACSDSGVKTVNFLSSLTRCISCKNLLRRSAPFSCASVASLFKPQPDDKGNSATSGNMVRLDSYEQQERRLRRARSCTDEGFHDDSIQLSRPKSK